MKLYYAQRTRAVRIAWLLEELGLDYDLQTFQNGEKAMREPDYLAVHPMGRVPALEVDGRVIHESGAIVEYLLTKHANGRMRPGVDDPNYADYLQWLHYCEGMIMPQMNVIMVETFFLPPDRQSEEHRNRATKLMRRALGPVDQHMEGREFLAGDFSGADIMLGHCVVMCKLLLGGLEDYPNLDSYADRLSARPAFQKAQSL